MAILNILNIMNIINKLYLIKYIEAQTISCRQKPYHKVTFTMSLIRCNGVSSPEHCGIDNQHDFAVTPTKDEEWNMRECCDARAR